MNLLEGYAVGARAVSCSQIGLIDLMQLLVEKHNEIAQDVRAENLSNSM